MVRDKCYTATKSTIATFDVLCKTFDNGAILQEAKFVMLAYVGYIFCCKWILFVN